MLYFLALIPATGLVVAGYLVLVLSARAEGALRSFGRYLGFWAFTLAALVILGAIFAAAHHGHRGFGPQGGMHCPWSGGPGFGPRPTEPEGPRAPAPPDASGGQPPSSAPPASH